MLLWRQSFRASRSVFLDRLQTQIEIFTALVSVGSLTDTWGIFLKTHRRTSHADYDTTVCNTYHHGTVEAHEVALETNEHEMMTVEGFRSVVGIE